MEVTFLGTGTSQGIPVIACECDTCRSEDLRDKRLRTSIHIRHHDLSIVVDTGPDFRQQMLQNRIQHLDAILLTHEHNDHVIGLDDVRPFNFKQGSAISLFASKRVLEELKKRFGYIFSDSDYPGKPRLKMVEILKNQTFDISGLKIIPINLLHGKMPVLGFRIGNFCYITDANHIPGSEIHKIRGSHTLVINALRKSWHHSHFSLEEAVNWANILGVKETYLIHMSHGMGPTTQWEQNLPENIHPSYDGLSIQIS